MKKLFLAGIIAAAFCSAPAHAAPPYNWSGCYIGGSVGGMWWGESETPFGFAGGEAFNRAPTGFIGGGQIGCDYQMPSNWLVGIQGEFNGARGRASETAVSVPISIETFDKKIDWFASATVRLGYASGPWLLYGKGGAAWVRDKFRDSGEIFIFPFDLSGDVTQTGWTAGAGLEYAFAPNWSASIEYDYYGFGTKSVTLTGTAFPAGATTESISLKQNFSVVKVGLNYRFATGR
jgi:outer membrane immunogenic protein